MRDEFKELAAEMRTVMAAWCDAMDVRATGEGSIQESLGALRLRLESALEELEPRVPHDIIRTLRAGGPAYVQVKPGERGTAYSGAGKAARQAVSRYMKRWDEDHNFESYYDGPSYKRRRARQEMAYRTNLALVVESTGEVLARGAAATRMAQAHPIGRLYVEVWPVQEDGSGV